MTAEEAAEAAAEEAREKKQQRMWQIIGALAMGVSIATGSDVPIFLCFFAQLFKADPSQLLQAWETSKLTPAAVKFTRRPSSPVSKAPLTTDA